MNEQVTYSYDMSQGMPLSSYNYRLRIKYIIGDTSFDITDSKVNFKVISNYKENIFPITICELMLKRGDLINIVTNKDIVVFKIDMTRVPINLSDGVKEALFEELVWQDLIMRAVDIPTELPPDSRETSNTDMIDKGETSNQYAMNLNLFPEELLNMNRYAIDVVFKDCEIKDAIIQLFNLNNVRPRSLIMGMPDNREKFYQVILPPYNLRNSINYLQDYYGIYREGYTLFHDFKYSYLISNNVVTNNKTLKNEFSTMFIELVDKMDGLDTQMPRYVKDDEGERYYVRMNDTSSVSDRSDSNRDLIGEDLTIMSRKQGYDSIDNFYSREVTTNFNNGATIVDIKNLTDNKNVYNEYILDEDDLPEIRDLTPVRRESKKKYLWDDSSNDFRLTSHLYDITKDGVRLEVPISDINIEYFTPNRSYFFKFSNREKNEKHGGYYQLVNMVYNIGGNTNDKSRLEGICIFVKLPKITYREVKS